MVYLQLLYKFKKKYLNRVNKGQVYLSILLPVCVTISVCLFKYLSVCPTINILFCLTVCLFVCLTVSVFVECFVPMDSLSLLINKILLKSGNIIVLILDGNSR